MKKEENILLGEWDMPPFGQIETGDYEPAIAEALGMARAKIEAIATNEAAPTYENTIEAIEEADSELRRVEAILSNLNECCTTDELQAVAMRVEPELTRFATEVSTDRRLYERVERVYAERHDKEQGERLTLLENTRKAFVRHGVALPEREQEEYRRNEEELSRLKLQFGQNTLADKNAWAMNITDESELAGLPESARAAAREEAASRGEEGWTFTLAMPSYGPFMAYSERRERREEMYRAYNSVGNHGGAHDNNATIARIVALRSRQAELLGYDTYCDYVLSDRMVGSLGRLREFMQRMLEAVLPAARADLDMLREEAGEGWGEVMPWDVSYLSERAKRRLFDIDEEALRPYFRLETVREGIFALYGRLYGLEFEEDKSVPVYHEEVRVYSVRQREGYASRVDDEERELGLLYLDMHPRASKRSGAWMTEFRGQHGKVRPQIQVVCNFSKPTGDAPALLRFGEVETFMHEMGHAMHGMLSQVRYESMSGTNVKRDFVEMPSQLMENWCYEAEFLATFARHWQSGEPLPMEQIGRIRAAQNHLAGWLCLRQLNLGMTDIAFHTAASAEKAETVEAEAMTDLLPRVEGCCTATSFGHIFGGGYASGYYGYKWAEVLDADIFERFKRDGIFCRETAAAFRREILERGGTEHPSTLFRNFMGREPDNGALLRRMGIGK